MNNSKFNYKGFWKSVLILAIMALLINSKNQYVVLITFLPAYVFAIMHLCVVMLKALPPLVKFIPNGMMKNLKLFSNKYSLFYL